MFVLYWYDLGRNCMSWQARTMTPTPAIKLRMVKTTAIASIIGHTNPNTAVHAMKESNNLTVLDSGKWIGARNKANRKKPKAVTWTIINRAKYAIFDQRLVSNLSPIASIRAPAANEQSMRKRAWMMRTKLRFTLFSPNLRIQPRQERRKSTGWQSISTTRTTMQKHQLRQGAKGSW